MDDLRTPPGRPSVRKHNDEIHRQPSLRIAFPERKKVCARPPGAANRKGAGEMAKSNSYFDVFRIFFLDLLFIYMFSYSTKSYQIHEHVISSHNICSAHTYTILSLFVYARLFAPVAIEKTRNAKRLQISRVNTSHSFKMILMSYSTEPSAVTLGNSAHFERISGTQTDKLGWEICQKYRWSNLPFSTYKICSFPG